MLQSGAVRRVFRQNGGSIIPLFNAPLLTSLIPTSATGSSTPTYSRASAAYVQDHEGVQRQVLANEARFWGARRVFNYDLKSDFSASWANVSGKIYPDPFGGNTAVLHTTTALTSYGSFTRYSLDSAWPTLHVGRKLLVSCYVKAGTATHVGLRMGSMGTNGLDQYITFNLATGVKQDQAGTAATYDRAEAINVGNGWWRIWMLGTSSSALVANDIALFNNAGGDTASAVQPSVTGYYYGHQVEDVTGQSVQTPSEYVPDLARAAGASFPSWVDGAQNFDTVRLHTQNMFTFSEQLGNAAWTKDNCTVTDGALANPVDGALTASAIVENGALGSRDVFQSRVPTWRQAVYSFWAKAGTRNYVWVYASGLNAGSVVFDLAGGTIVYNEASVTANMVAGANGWWLCTVFNNRGDMTGTGGFVLNPNNATTPGSYTGVNGNVAVYIYAPSQRIYSPSVLSTYVATTATAADPTATGTTTPIPATTLLGYLSETTGTQLVTPNAAIRLVSDASWAKVGAPTITTTTGVDGVANACNRITSIAGNTTILQTLASAATSRTFSVYIKRITGTGNIELCQDGVTFTNINGSLILGQWVRVQLNANVTPAIFGVRIVAATDAIEMDFMQFEAENSIGTGATSPMATTGLSRNPDALTWPSASNINVAQGAAYSEFRGLAPFKINAGLFKVSGTPDGTFIRTDGGANFAPADGTNVVGTAGVLAANTNYKGAVAWGPTAGAGLLSAVRTGVSLATATFSGSMGASLTTITVDGSAGTSQTIRNLRIYAQKLTDAQLTAMVA